jgi:hypothetical protein
MNAFIEKAKLMLGLLAFIWIFGCTVGSWPH